MRALRPSPARVLGAVAIALAAAPSPAAQPATVTVLLTDYRFVPDRVQFRADVPYRLHLENAGKYLHEFTAPDFFKTTELTNPDIMNAERTEVVLQPHQTKDLFLVAHTKGTFELTCADHDWEGMVGKITVE